jgi:hypothetical protein
MAVMPAEICLLNQTTAITANGNGAVFNLPATYNGAILYLTAGIPTGTSPTLDVYIQQGFTAILAADQSTLQVTNTAIPTIWDDYAHFTQLAFSAAAQSQVMRILVGTGAVTNTDTRTASVSAASNAALGAGIVKPGPLGMFWRVLWVVGGTSPSWPSLTITAQMVNAQG